MNKFAGVIRYYGISWLRLDGAFSFPSSLIVRIFQLWTTERLFGESYVIKILKNISRGYRGVTKGINPKDKQECHFVY